MGIQDEEDQYLNLIKEILSAGEHRQDRTNTGTLSIFAPPQLRFNLVANKFPLLTTKKVGLRIVFEELIWFVKGSTDGQELLDKKVTIWEGNGSREYLDSRGLFHYRERRK
jgi:thymidylate synthase